MESKVSVQTTSEVGGVFVPMVSTIERFHCNTCTLLYRFIQFPEKPLREVDTLGMLPISMIVNNLSSY